LLETARNALLWRKTMHLLKTLTFQFEEALLSAEGLAILSGAKKTKRAA